MRRAGGRSDSRDTNGGLTRQGSNRSSSQPPRTPPKRGTDKNISIPEDAIISYVDEQGRPHYYDVATGDIYTGAKNSPSRIPLPPPPKASSVSAASPTHDRASMEASSPSLSGLAALASGSRRLHPSATAARQEVAGPVSLERSSMDAAPPTLSALALLASSAQSSKSLTPLGTSSSSRRSFFSSCGSCSSCESGCNSSSGNDLSNSSLRSLSPPSRLPSFYASVSSSSSSCCSPVASSSSLLPRANVGSAHPTISLRPGSRSRLHETSSHSNHTNNNDHNNNHSSSSSASTRSDSKPRLALPRSGSKSRAEPKSAKESWKLFGRSKAEDKEGEPSVEAKAAKIDHDMKKLKAKRHSWVDSLRGDNDFAATQRKIRELELQKAELMQQERASTIRLEQFKSARSLLQASADERASRHLTQDNALEIHRLKLEKLSPTNSDSASDTFPSKFGSPISPSHALSKIDSGSRLSNAEFLRLSNAEFLRPSNADLTRPFADLSSNTDLTLSAAANNDNNNSLSGNTEFDLSIQRLEKAERTRSDSSQSDNLVASTIHENHNSSYRSNGGMSGNSGGSSGNSGRGRDDSLGSRSDVMVSPSKYRMKELAPASGLYSVSSCSSFLPSSSSISASSPSDLAPSTSMTEISERILKLLSPKHDPDNPSSPRTSTSSVDASLRNDDDSTRRELKFKPSNSQHSDHSGSSRQSATQLERMSLVDSESLELLRRQDQERQQLSSPEAVSEQSLFERKLKDHLRREQSLKDQILKGQVREQILKSQLEQASSAGLTLKEQQTMQQLTDNAVVETLLKESLSKEDAIKSELMLQRDRFQSGI